MPQSLLLCHDLALFHSNLALFVHHLNGVQHLFQQNFTITITGGDEKKQQSTTKSW
jgi:hypothetical protein